MAVRRSEELQTQVKFPALSRPEHDMFGIGEDSSREIEKQKNTDTSSTNCIMAGSGNTVMGGEPLSYKHPREGLPSWKWPTTVVILILITLVHGYDVSNIANIQPSIYKQFGHITLLPWVNLSYAASCFVIFPVSRKLFQCFNIRWITTASLIIFMTGSVVAASSQTINAIIIGRIIMGTGGGLAQQCGFLFVSFFATPLETSKLMSMIGAAWATGLVVGGPIGSGFASSSLTWRWAFYVNLPFLAISLIGGLIAFPSHSIAHTGPLLSQLSSLDPIGVILNAALMMLFCTATIFSGVTWEWGTTQSVAIWCAVGITALLYVTQQYFALFTKPNERAFPLSPRLISTGRLRSLVPIWLATFSAGATYGIMLYYSPLYFAFAKGSTAIQQTRYTLPFVLVFVASVIFAGITLPIVGRYQIYYMVAGVLIMSPGAALVSKLISGNDISIGYFLAMEALVGFGLGLIFQHGLSLSNAMLHESRAKADSVAIFSLAQLGGVSIALAVAGSVYENIGYRKILEKTKGMPINPTKDQLLELLAGQHSTHNMAAAKMASSIVSEVLGRVFCIMLAAGVLCFVCGLSMKREKLDFGRAKRIKNNGVAGKV